MSKEYIYSSRNASVTASLLTLGGTTYPISNISSYRVVERGEWDRDKEKQPIEFGIACGIILAVLLFVPNYFKWWDIFTFTALAWTGVIGCLLAWFWLDQWGSQVLVIKEYRLEFTSAGTEHSVLISEDRRHAYNLRDALTSAISGDEYTPHELHPI